MNKLGIALIAITIITASVLSAPYSTEARNNSDARSALAERHGSIVEIRTYEGNKDKKGDNSNVSVTPSRAGEVKSTDHSGSTSSSLGTMPANSTKKVPVSEPSTTQPIVKVADKVTENKVEPVVSSKETVNNDSANAPSDEFMMVLSSEIHRLTNVERQRAGVSTLVQDTALAAIAKRHSEDMAQHNYFSHTAPNGCTLTCRLSKAGYKAQAWGENIAWRSSSKLPEAKELAAYFMNQWMNSEGHRHNILSGNFTHEGVGLARIGNKVYVTVDFAKPQ